ncbi:MAG: hypothetical protein AB7S78_00690 [Candidatus Omnitrophota bacterium]
MKVKVCAEICFMVIGIVTFGVIPLSQVMAQDLTDQPAQQMEAPPGQGTIIETVENGRVKAVQYTLKKAKKILGIWAKFQQTPESDALKMQYYNIAIQQKDALISEVYDLCSNSRDRENEFCKIYPDIVLMLGPIPDLVPGKWQ